MRFKREYRYKVPLDDVVKHCVEDFFNNPDVKIGSPNVKSCELVKKDDKGEKVYVAFRYCAHGDIPKIFQPIIKPKMLTWIEDSVWDRSSKTYAYNIKTFYFTKQFSCRGRWKHYENGNGGTVQTLKGNLKIRIPFFGPLIEKEIIKHLYENFDDGYKKAKQELKRKGAVTND